MLLTGLNSFSKVIIVTDASKFERVKDKKYASIINILLTGLNSFSKVIIVADINKFEKLEDRKHADIINTLLI